MIHYLENNISGELKTLCGSTPLLPRGNFIHVMWLTKEDKRDTCSSCKEKLPANTMEVYYIIV